MTVSELIKKLQKLDQEKPVYVYADHGQNPEEASEVVEGLSYVEFFDDDIDCVTIYGQ